MVIIMFQAKTKIYSKYINPYIDKILNNEVEHCTEQELMIKNIVIPTLNRDDIYIDEEKIEKGLSLQKYFPYKLIEWEIFLFALIVGVFLKQNEYIDIFFKEINAIVGRGAGKNGFISFLCFYFLSPYHGVQHYDIDLLANSEEQAKRSFKDVYEVITDNYDKKNNKKKLEKHFYATKEAILGTKTKSILKYNTSSKRGKDSKRTGCVIYDEKHEYQDSKNINTLKSGLGKTKFGREITITTNGHVRGGVLDKDLTRFKDILKEYNQQNRTLVFWCKIEKEDEWKNPKKWIKAIPSINDFPELRYTIEKEVLDMPYNQDYFPEFMAKRMNFPIGNKEIEVAKWDDNVACNQGLIDLEGCECIGGLDYAKTDDFVAVCLLFKKQEMYYVIHHTFICKKSRDLQGIKAPLKEWEQKGDLTFIDDVEIPPSVVVNWFFEKSKQYKIKKIAIDFFRFSLMNLELKKIGYDAYEKKNVKLVRPSDIMKVSPIINSIFVNRNFAWGDSPIMNWYVNNTKKIMNNGNITYGKIEENYRKTDGFMALVSAMTLSDELSVTNENAQIFDSIDF